MPGGDRTGPNGFGPSTGRRLGYCFGYDTPGFTQGLGLGFRRAYGRTRGWGRNRGIIYGNYLPLQNAYYEPPLVSIPVYKSVENIDPYSSEGQLEMLKQEKEYMESELKDLQNAIEDISKRISKLEENK